MWRPGDTALATRLVTWLLTWTKRVLSGERRAVELVLKLLLGRRSVRQECRRRSCDTWVEVAGATRMATLPWRRRCPMDEADTPTPDGVSSNRESCFNT